MPARWQRAHPGEQRVFTNATLPGVQHSGVPVRRRPRAAPRARLAHAAARRARRCAAGGRGRGRRPPVPAARTPACRVGGCLPAERRRARAGRVAPCGARGACGASARQEAVLRMRAGARGSPARAARAAGRVGLTRAGGARRARAGAGQPLRLRPVRADLLRLLHGRAAAGRPGAQGRQGQARGAGRRGDRGRAAPNPQALTGFRVFAAGSAAAAGSTERGSSWSRPACGLAGRGLCAGPQRCA